MSATKHAYTTIIKAHIKGKKSRKKYPAERFLCYFLFVLTDRFQVKRMSRVEWDPMLVSTISQPVVAVSGFTSDHNVG